MVTLSVSRSFLDDLSRGLVDLLYPPECSWCGQATQDDRRLCDACRRLFVSDYYRCQKCATPLPSVVPNRDCFRCRAAKWRFSQVIALAPYRGELRKAVIMMKKPRFELLRRAIGELLAEKLRSENLLNGTRQGQDDEPENEQLPLIFPVPNHWSHGFSSAADTAHSLAQAIARPTGLRVIRGIVRRSRKTAKQGMLSWAERRQNVRGAFVVKSSKQLKGRHILLVDDVLTSGATAAELAALLIKAGAERVSVVVAARGTGTRESPSS